jgi:hypothetical protein
MLHRWCFIIYMDEVEYLIGVFGVGYGKAVIMFNMIYYKNPHGGRNVVQWFVMLDLGRFCSTTARV